MKGAVLEPEKPGPPGSRGGPLRRGCLAAWWRRDRKSTRLNSSHVRISYAVFCLKKKKESKMYHYACITKSVRLYCHNPHYQLTIPHDTLECIATRGSYGYASKWMNPAINVACIT